jgi:hypothetical protein
MFWKKLTFIVSAALVCTGLATANAQMSDIYVGQDEASLNIVESFFNTGESISRLSLHYPNNGGGTLCDSKTLAPCSSKDQISALIVLPPCETITDEWCIDGLSLYQKGNISIVDNAKFVRETEGPTVPKNSELGLPAGGTVSLWQTDSVKHKGNSNTYAIYAAVTGDLQKSNSKFSFSNFSAMIFPYSEKNGNYNEAQMSNITDPQGRPNIGISGGTAECAWTERNKCGYIEDFSENTRAKLSIRLGNTLSGWLMGRMSEPIIEVRQISSTQNLITVDSEPVAIPKFQKKIKITDATPELLLVDPQVKYQGMHNDLSSRSLQTFLAWSKVVDDKANGLETVWSIRTTTNGMGSRCLQDSSKLLGLVSTNAMVYEGTAPSYSDSTLQYKVAGLHFNADGTPFVGKYDLLMRSEVARCIYGLSNLPISADISITSADGNAKVATTVMNESNGWLRLGAYGFTFSAPVIKVKLAQAGKFPLETSNLKPKENPSSVGTSSAKQTVIRQITITCTKGKIVKKITKSQPKCPSGYKRK